MCQKLPGDLKKCILQLKKNVWNCNGRPLLR